MNLLGNNFVLLPSIVELIEEILIHSFTFTIYNYSDKTNHSLVKTKQNGQIKTKEQKIKESKTAL